MNKKRILIISNLFPSPWEPNRSTFNYQQFSRLGKYYSVTVYIPVPFMVYFRNKESILETSDGEVLISKKYFPFFYLPLLFRFLHAPSLLASLLIRFKSIKKLDVDIVIGSWVNPDGFAALILSKILKVPCIIKAHGNDINVLGEELIRGWFIRWTLSNANNVVCVSNELMKKVIKLTKNKVVVDVVYNGVDRSIFFQRNFLNTRKRYDIGEKDRVIIYVGNLKKTKGVLDLYFSFKDVLKQGRAKLFFIGSGECESILMRKIENDRLNDSVVLLGSLAPKVVAEYISISNVLCLPSYNEGVPNVLLEAKACGVPVVASDVGGVSEVVNEFDGILVEKKNREKLSKALNDALNKHWNKEAIIAQSLSYSWDKSVIEFHEIIKKYIR